MLALLVGLLLMPSAAIALVVAAQTLEVLATSSRAAAPFLAGVVLSALVRVFVDFYDSALGTILRHIYVVGHEMTHALAAWAVGGKVHSFKAGPDGGHVDLSHSNAFIALAPYCIPVYTIAVVFGYRLLLWFRPDWGAESVYLFLMGLSFSFHAVFTFDCLWDRKQPDLAAAGGAIFSLSIIALANGIVVLLLLKALFPQGVLLGDSLGRVISLTLFFWRGLFDLGRQVFPR